MEEKIKIESINTLLEKNLHIPKYQRPYKWSNKNIIELLEDIKNAIDFDRNYRIGTIILYEDENNKKNYDIVDGQQRVISMILINKYLDENYDCPLIKNSKFKNISIKNIQENYIYIKEWFLNDKKLEKDFKNALKQQIEVVVIKTNKLSEAFQLFDCQNNRGKPLYPHDLLKAYHLREMTQNSKKMSQKIKKTVEQWENKNDDDIADLFDKYLFRINEWTKNEKPDKFSVYDIDMFKGISKKLDNYEYVKRIKRTSTHYQITEPFIAGENFFSIVNKYIELKERIENTFEGRKENKIESPDENEFIKQIEKLEDIIEILNDDKYKNYTGFKYVKEMFYSAVLAYYDRFNNLDYTVIKKIFLWAFSLRIDLPFSLGKASINKYALGGENNSKYTNQVKMFNIIENARVHSEIKNIIIEIPEKEVVNLDNKTENLWRADFKIKVKNI